MRYALALCFPIFAGGKAVAFERFEEIAHTVVQKDSDIQVRDYAETVAAEVTVQGSRHEAPSKAFRALFDYINGDNTAAQEISMTAPVSQEQSQQISYTRSSRAGSIKPACVPHDGGSVTGAGSLSHEICSCSRRS